MKLRKSVSYIIISFICLFMFVGISTGTVHAEDVSVTIGLTPDGNIAVGDTITATIIINGENISGYTINLDYTPGLLQYQSEAENGGSIAINGTGATTLTYTFKAIQEGRATISTSGSSVYDIDGNPMTIAHAGATVMVGNIASEEDAIKIGNDTYTLVNEYHLPKQPEGYELSYVNYKDKDIYAYQAPDQQIKVVCLQNADGEQKWFVYDEQSQSFSPFIQYSLDGVSYVIINKPEDVKLPEGFIENSLSLDNVQFTAYTDGSDSGMYLVYALNMRGDSGFYYYDTDEGSFTKYDSVKRVIDFATASSAAKAEEASSGNEYATEVSYATPLIPKPEPKKPAVQDDGLVSRDTLKKLLTMMILLFVIMCVVVIILVVKNGILQSQLDDEEDEDDTVRRAKNDARKKSDEEQQEKKNNTISRNKSYAVNEDTGEILLEEAEDNNSGVNVPPAKDIKKSKIKDEMEKKPFGIDSAFSVASADEAPQGENVYQEPDPAGDIVDQETVEMMRREKTFAAELEHNQKLNEKNAEEFENKQSEQQVEKKAKSEREELIDTIFSDDEEFEKSIKKKNRKDRRNKNKKNKDKKAQKAAEEVADKAATEQVKKAEDEVWSKPEGEPEDTAALSETLDSVQSEAVEKKESAVQTESTQNKEVAQKKETEPEKEPQKVALPGELLEEEE